MTRRRFAIIAAATLGALLLFAGGWIAGRTGIGAVVAPASLPELERQFAERMRNVTLVGTFTIAGREDRPSSPDRYDIASVEKVGDDLWRFNARVHCCGMGDSGTLPIVVPMQWIGDTPVIMMTDTSIPALGTFTARVFFHGDRYAGTWQHGQYGGHMTGRIDRQGAPDAR